MVAAIGSPQTADITYAAGTSTAGIEAQLARYQKELSDCINCASAKTPEGKAAIEAATNKIRLAEARIESIHVARQASLPTEARAAANQDLEGSLYRAEAVHPAQSFDGITGTRIDIFA